MTYNGKKSLYNNIMKEVSKIVKNKLNEFFTYNNNVVLNEKLNELDIPNDIAKKVDDFFYNISWHRSIGFDTKEECQYLIDALQKYYNFNAKKTYDNRKDTHSLILNGQHKNNDVTVNITIAFYQDGDPWNDYAYCDLLKP